MADPVSQAQGLLTGNMGRADLSKQLLDSLFGGGWQDLLSGAASGATAGSAANLIMTLLMAFNVVAMAVAAVMVSWNICHGVIGTAHEGEPLGKRFHTFWAPIRSAISISFLAPVVKGMSILQVLILVSVGYSVNFANYLSGQSLDYLNKNSGQVVMHVPESLKDNAKLVAKDALEVLVVQQYQIYLLGQKMAGSMAFTQWVPSTKEGEKGQWLVLFNSPEESGLSTFDMGGIAIPAEGRSDPVARARLNGVMAMLTQLKPIASGIVQREIPAMNESQAAPPPLDPAGLMRVVDRYTAKISPQIASIIAANNPAFKLELKKFTRQAQNDGWVALGQYYWTLSRFSEKVHQITYNLPRFIAYDKDRIQKYSLPDIQDSLAAVESYTGRALMLENQMVAARLGGDSWERSVNEFLQRWTGSFGLIPLVEGMTKGDPIENLASTGHAILAGTGVAFTGYMTAVFAAGYADQNLDNGLGSLVGWIPGIGQGANGIVGGMMAILKQLGFFIALGFIPVLMLAVMLAYYLPALPFILWIAAVVGWVILVVETLFAAPLWAVAHSIPEGEGFAGQHGRQGYMLLFNVLVRPPLMVGGFFCALIIMQWIGKFVGSSFLIFTASVMGGDYVLTPISTIIMIFIIGGLMVVLMHKVFGLITHLPENVTKWVGQLAQNLGEKEDEQRTRAMFMGAAGKTEGGVNSAVARAKGQLSEGANDTLVAGEDAKIDKDLQMGGASASQGGQSMTDGEMDASTASPGGIGNSSPHSKPSGDAGSRGLED